jgi:hypothetical protein
VATLALGGRSQRECQVGVVVVVVVASGASGTLVVTRSAVNVLATVGSAPNST